MKTFGELSMYLHKERERDRLIERKNNIEAKKIMAEQERGYWDTLKAQASRMDKIKGCDPVNREARMLLAKAPWYTHAPFIETKKENKMKTKKRKDGDMVKLLSKRAFKPVETDTYGAVADESVSAVGMAKNMVAVADEEVPRKAMELAQTAKAAREIMQESMHHIGDVMNDLDLVVKSGLDNVRQKRFAVVTEASSITKALKDIRAFFIGPDYQKERDRLADFVELCERLQALKESGFLDTVADTMIRLSSIEDKGE